MGFRRLDTSVRRIATTVAVVLAVATLSIQARAADAPETPAAAGGTPQQNDQTAGATPKAVGSAAPTKCQKIAEALGKRTADAALLNSADAHAVGLQNPELVMCSAVLTDSDEPCKRYLPSGQGPSNACLQLRAIFHELKANPGKPTYMFTDFDWQLCRSNPDFTQTCDKLRAALRSGNEKDCAGIGIAEPLCRAAMSGDKTKCDLKVAAAEGKVLSPDPQGKGPVTANVSEMIAQDCHEKLDTRLRLAGGLKKLAESGSPQEQPLARAALGEADACATLVKQATGRCPGETGPAADSTPAATPRPAPQEP
jgi:hypothetical protein